MHRSFFAVKDTTINSGSHLIDGTTFQDKNVGQDEVLELKKVFDNKEFKHPTRMLIQFDTNEVLNYVSSSIINGGQQHQGSGNFKYFLKLYEAAGNSGLSNEYTIAAYPLSESWDEGIGKEEDNPKTTVGCSWLNRENRGGQISEVSWSNAGGTYIASDEVTQSFSLSSPDIEMDITSMVNKWLSGENKNHGILLRFSGSSELGTQVSGSVSQSLDLTNHSQVSMSATISQSNFDFNPVLRDAETSISTSLDVIQNLSASISSSISESLMLVEHVSTFSSSVSASIKGYLGDGGIHTFLIDVNGGVYRFFAGNSRMDQQPPNYYPNPGTAQPTPNIYRGNNYLFYQTGYSATNATHPMRLSTTNDGTHNGGSQYIGDKGGSGTMGNVEYSASLDGSGDISHFTFKPDFNTPDTLYYYCANHPGMGGQMNIIDHSLFVDPGITVSSSISQSLTQSFHTLHSSSMAISESLILVSHFSASISSSISSSIGVLEHTTNVTSESISQSLDLNTQNITHILSTGQAEDLKFFSRQTNTIYSPKLELRWNDQTSYDGTTTGSLQALDISGETENYVYQIHTKEAYNENEIAKFRFGARKRYIDKSFSTSIQTVSGSYFPEGSTLYSIVDMATNEDVVPFSSYTSMSVDPISPYFQQDLNGFEPNRAYKILLKTKQSNGQTVIHDEDFEFIIRS